MQRFSDEIESTNGVSQKGGTLGLGAGYSFLFVATS